MIEIIVPQICPTCSYKLVTIGEQLFCQNTICEAQLGKKVEHFCKTLSIKGAGPVAIQKLNIQDITELFYLDRDFVIEVLGAKVADKLLDEIERCKVADLATVLAAMGIPLVGPTASNKISSVVTSIEEITIEKCREAGLGEKVTNNLMNWLETEYIEIKEFLPFSFKSTKKLVNTDAKKVCITGKLVSYKRKADAEQVLLAAGFELVSSVTKATDYLVDESDEFEEGFKPSEKRKKAISYGITIIKDINILTERKENYDRI